MGYLIPGRWYAVHVRYQTERLVAQLLRYKGYDEFLPLYNTAVDNGRRKTVRELPLFPGYVFCRMNDEPNGSIITTPGVLRILGVGNRPHPISRDEFQRLRVITRLDLDVTPWPRFEPGDAVVLNEGPLKGCSGVLVRWRGNSWLVVSITLLRRSVAVTVSKEWVTPVHSQFAARNPLDHAPVIRAEHDLLKRSKGTLVEDPLG